MKIGDCRWENQLSEEAQERPERVVGEVHE